LPPAVWGFTFLSPEPFNFRVPGSNFAGQEEPECIQGTRLTQNLRLPDSPGDISRPHAERSGGSSLLLPVYTCPSPWRFTWGPGAVTGPLVAAERGCSSSQVSSG
jgi:hypothetical protein